MHIFIITYRYAVNKPQFAVLGWRMKVFCYNKKKIFTVVLAVLLFAVCAGAYWEQSGKADENAVKASLEENARLLAYVTEAGNPKNGGVSLIFMVDENSDVDILAETMQILKDNQIKATFFMTGKFAEAHGDIAQSLWQRGCEIGVSGYEAVSPANLDYGENLAALEKATTVIRGITGEAVRFYSPPFGVLEEDIYKAVNESDLTFVLAGVDSMDWDDVSAEAIIGAVLAKAEKGSIISLHPTDMTNLGLQTIINELKGLHLKFLTVSENVGV